MFDCSEAFNSESHIAEQFWHLREQCFYKLDAVPDAYVSMSVYRRHTFNL